MTTSSRRRAFTLIELLVVIGVIGILIGLILPALGSARTQARQTLSLTNVRSIGQSFALYADAHEVYPFPGKIDIDNASVPGDLYSMRWYARDGEAIIAISDVWPMATLWPALVSDITPWEEAFEIWVSPGRDKSLPDVDLLTELEPQEVVSYEYSHSFLARPRNWSDGASADPSLVAPTRPAGVRSPAGKVLLYDSDLTYRREQPGIVDGHYDALTPMAFADGHGDVLSPLDAKPTTPNPLNGTDIRALHNTVEGIQGIDY
ncbi:MAG: type II secretion system protein [Planctomycetota bacterium]